jgi:hypothetical protein
MNIRQQQQQQPPFPIVLAIDPSMNNLGWAAHNLNLGCNRYDIDSDAWRFGLIHPKARTTDCQYKWRDAYTKLRSAVGDWKPTHLASEWPSFYASTKGRIAAMKGYTIDLAGMTAYIAGRLGLPPDFITLWTAQQWKGSVPKHATQAKFLRLFGDGAGTILRNCSHDVIDAIMIAEYWLTLYHREKFTWIKRWQAQVQQQPLARANVDVNAI